MASFQKRALACMKKGDLTVFDLHTWLGRPYATVWQWVNSGWEPGRKASHQSTKRSPSGEKALRDLALLESAISRGAFPVPEEITQSSRRDYVRSAYAKHARLPQARSAK